MGVSIKYTERLAEAGIEPSVGSVGDSYDNALAETINGLYKAEVIHRRGPWRSFETVECAASDVRQDFRFLDHDRCFAAGYDQRAFLPLGTLTNPERIGYAYQHQCCEPPP
jgi:hypothetical protein